MLSQGRAALRRVVRARGGAIPVEAMAELIDLATRHEGVRLKLLAEMNKQLLNADRDMALAWLCVVASELGRDGLVALIDLLGQTDSDDVAEAGIQTLMRHVLAAYEDVRRALDASESEDQRECLYEG